MEQPICGLSEVQIQELKQEHGVLILGTVKQGEETFHAIFKEPSFQVLESVGAISEKSEVKGSVALYDNCVIAADEAFKTRDFLKLKAIESLAKHMNSFSVEVKNL